MSSSVRADLGPLRDAWEAESRALEGASADSRLWQRDGHLWSAYPDVAHSIRQRLGWLESPLTIRRDLSRILEFRNRLADIRRVVLLGMGGSSLGPEVMAHVLPREGPPLVVLDSTSPDAIHEVEREGLDRTLFFVSSKSGTTVETRTLADYFMEKTRGSRGVIFVAITDEGTPLAARRASYAELFIAPSDIGGRYSAFSVFGLAPAAAAGVDIGRLVEQTLPMVDACRSGQPDNPGAWLAAVLAAGVRVGRDKLTFVLSPSLAGLGAWLEQLVAESTGKDGTAVLPIDGELLAGPEAYGPDRLFVRIALASEADEATDHLLDRLIRAGHPVVRIVIDDPYDLGAEFFRWEVATALAGFLLGINPFDEPNVQQAKDQTARLLDEVRREGRLPAPGGGPGEGTTGTTLIGYPPAADLSRAIAAFLNEARPPAYVAFLAYAPRSTQNEYALAAMRRAVRDTLKVATIRGFGPRYLHSIGQAFKGGPNTGYYLVFTADVGTDLAVPGEPYGFGTLLRAQGLGDIGAMRDGGRRVLHIHLGDAERGLQVATDHIHERFPAAFESGVEVSG